jgi:hypothetical protein
MTRTTEIMLALATLVMVFLQGINIGSTYTRSKLRETAGPVRCSGALIVERDFGGGTVSARCGGGR